MNERYDLMEVDLTSIHEGGEWRSVSGRVRTSVIWRDPNQPVVHRLGDAVEIVGRLSSPNPPGNPGERDPRQRLLDRRIRGDLRTEGLGVVRLESGEYPWLSVLSRIRRYGIAVLNDHLSESRSPVARALLLGDTNALDRSEWDAYIRTGVVHVLAISGQHLMLLASILWILLNLFRFHRRQVAFTVVLVVGAYAILTGLRPSALRAGVMVGLVGGGVLLRRPVHPANTLAAAWLAVAAINPADLFDLGCRLSFASVFMLIWGIRPLVQPRKLTPLDRLIDESRSTAARSIRGLVRMIGVAYLVNALLFITNTPLLIAEQNVASPIGLMVGPPLILFTSIALIAGFLLLLAAPVPGVADLLAAITQQSLNLCQWLVHQADSIPGGTIYLPGLPGWWLAGFYLLLAAVVLVRLPRLYMVTLFAVWVLAALAAPGRDLPAGELRVAFLSVGHGSCTVIETPDGRCVLYDSGSSFGSDATRRVIAPYLWHRGIRRLDEIYLSHADTDHFNGLPELLRRFPVGRVTLTPSFAEKPTHEVAEVLLAIHRHRIPTRLGFAGQVLEAGEVKFRILHPPRDGPPGSENVRSMVLRIEHAGHRILLMGDLEQPGLAALLRQPGERVDLLQAPHHGSQRAFPNSLVEWARPRFVVVSRGTQYTNQITEQQLGAGLPIWDTPTHGTITVRSHPAGLSVHGYLSGQMAAIARE